MKFDRIFNKVEKFHGRRFNDPDNHERREKRMIDRKRDRWANHYTYFFGDLTEEEQMYRDYFETDLELEPENEVLEEKLDEFRLLTSGEFDMHRFDFVELALKDEVHETFEDVVEDKIFRYKYRLANHKEEDFLRREKRKIDRFMERAKHRDSKIEADLSEIFINDYHKRSIGQAFLNQFDNTNLASEKTKAIREYMIIEAIQQYKDFYETDAGEQDFFEYLDSLPHRERIRMMELYEDPTIQYTDEKKMVKIPKREYNTELSLFSNIVLDLMDFKDRVIPMAQDAAYVDTTRKFQRASAEEASKKDRILPY